MRRLKEFLDYFQTPKFKEMYGKYFVKFYLGPIQHENKPLNTKVYSKVK